MSMSVEVPVICLASFNPYYEMSTTPWRNDNYLLKK